ncbi:MAG: hypothetical protein KDI75_10500 [Xanthomonadales bacterium]|nr:hypothetical protein [Xanthomonadales bacterium]
MSESNTDAGSGVTWLSQGLQLFLKNPVPFAVMGLILGVIGMVPLLGGLVMMILGPALYAGMMSGYRAEAGGGKAEIGNLFAAFQQEGKVVKLLPLCLPGIAAAIVIGIVAGVLLIGAVATAAGGSVAASQMSSPEGVMAMMSGVGIIGGLIALVVFIAVALVAWALLFTAIPRVMFDGVEPFTAMKESFGTVKSNLFAFIGFALVAMIGYAVVAFVLNLLLGWSWITSFLPPLLMAAGFTPVIVGGLYSAYRQLFGGAAVAEALPEVPAAPPPAPPAEGDGADKPDA